jgi:hypothetical protein
VVVAVESHFRDAKVHAFKKKPRKRYSVLKGHRAQITALRVLQVGGGGDGGGGGGGTLGLRAVPRGGVAALLRGVSVAGGGRPCLAE